MSVAQKHLTLEEFLKLPETEPASEYQDGRITQKPLPKGKHSTLQFEIASWISQRTKDRQIGRAFPELRCTFAGRSIVPDVAYVAWDRIPREPSGAVADEFFLAPDIEVEVISPKQNARTLTEKLTFCVQNGCGLGLLVDPYAETITVFRPGLPPETLIQGPLSLPPVLEGLHLTVEEVFGWLK
jgi:Uma2 family endonuclease